MIIVIKPCTNIIGMYSELYVHTEYFSDRGNVNMKNYDNVTKFDYEVSCHIMLLTVSEGYTV